MNLITQRLRSFLLYQCILGAVLDDSDFLPKHTLALTEFDQKQSIGSGGIEIGNSSNTDDGNDEIGIRCWIPSPISLLKLLSLCPRLKTIRLLTEERQLAVFAEALSDMEEDFMIEEVEVYFVFLFMHLFASNLIFVEILDGLLTNFHNF